MALYFLFPPFADNPSAGRQARTTAEQYAAARGWGDIGRDQYFDWPYPLLRSDGKLNLPPQIEEGATLVVQTLSQLGGGAREIKLALTRLSTFDLHVIELGGSVEPHRSGLKLGLEMAITEQERRVREEIAHKDELAAAWRDAQSFQHSYAANLVRQFGIPAGGIAEPEPLPVDLDALERDALETRAANGDEKAAQLAENRRRVQQAEAEIIAQRTDAGAEPQAQQTDAEGAVRGETIKAERQRRGLTLDQLAGMAEVSRTQLFRAESGTAVTGLGSILKVLELDTEFPAGSAPQSPQTVQTLDEAEGVV